MVYSSESRRLVGGRARCVRGGCVLSARTGGTMVAQGDLVGQRGGLYGVLSLVDEGGQKVRHGRWTRMDEGEEGMKMAGWTRRTVISDRFHMTTLATVTAVSISDIQSPRHAAGARTRPSSTRPLHRNVPQLGPTLTRFNGVLQCRAKTCAV